MQMVLKLVVDLKRIVMLMNVSAIRLLFIVSLFCIEFSLFIFMFFITLLQCCNPRDHGLSLGTPRDHDLSLKTPPDHGRSKRIDLGLLIVILSCRNALVELTAVLCCSSMSFSIV